MSLIETETIKSANVHVLECSACGHTCEHVNGDYDYCPHCGDFVGETVYEHYFSTPEKLAENMSCTCDCYSCSFPPEIPCSFKDFTADKSTIPKWLKSNYKEVKK